MDSSSHLEELRKKHAELSRQVEEAQKAPGSDDLEISEMKKLKLKIKEEIAKLESA